MSPAALTTAALSCGYGSGRPPILDRLDLTVGTGRLICIIGPNGSGKSTLVRTLAGLMPAISGEVRLDGRNLASFSPVERARRVSVVLTRLPGTGYMTVRGFVEMGRHPYTGTLGRMDHTDHEAVDRAIRQVGISHLSSRLLSEISDGEKQRAAIARAFAQAATLMILDEPTAFLDVESRAIVMTTLRSLARETGRSVVATSHDIELVLRVADEVWMIAPDRSVRTGAPEDLVLDGAMEVVFPRHVMQFDLATGGFRLPHPGGEPVTVVGRGTAAEWTARALERIGMHVTSESDVPHASLAPRSAGSAAASPVVEVAAGPAWTLRAGNVESAFTSIASLTENLRARTPGSDSGTET